MVSSVYLKDLFFRVGKYSRRVVLIRQRTEVLHMLLTEFDEKKYKRTVYQDGYEDGELAGYRRGEEAGFQAMIEKIRNDR